MRNATFYASGLLELHKVTGASERRASWRQSMAALARAAAEDGPGPLEGLHSEALLAGAQAALHSGLADDLDWLAPAAAGAALYELAAALPLGPEQRDLGRRVLARLLAGDAETFVAIAHRMALGGGRGLGSAAIKARIALVAEMPIAAGVPDGPLALALASRRDLAREWFGNPSTGSLPSRRLAARLIERAAREVARRASQGDDHGLRVFKADTMVQAWERLLADREPLVWKHVAVARGLLAPWSPALGRAIEEGMAPSLSPTEWRRAAASIAALVASSPQGGLMLTHRAIARGLLERDPGAAAAFLSGLPRAGEAEPEAALEVLDRVLERSAEALGEAALDLRFELGDSPLTQRAAAHTLRVLAAQPKSTGDDGADALANEMARDLEGAARDDDLVRDQIARALGAFAADGAKGAYALARDALTTARGSLDTLEAVSRDEDAAEAMAFSGGADGSDRPTPIGSTAYSGAPVSSRASAPSIVRRTSLAVMRDLDMSLLEHDVLACLLSLGGGEAVRGVDEALDGLRDRLADWIVAREGKPLIAVAGQMSDPPHPMLSMRRLRALLHLVDGDIGDADGDPQRAARLRKRYLRIARALLDRFERDPPSAFRRTIVAALARALDALVRVGAFDAMDALLVVARHVADAAELRTLAEASMDPNLVHVLGRYARFAEAIAADPQGGLPAFDELTRDLALDASGRSEALRAVLLRLGGGLGVLASAPSLRALAPMGSAEPEAISSLEAALAALAQLAIGARGRLDPDRARVAPPGGLHPLTVAVSRVLSGADAALGEHVIAASLDHLLAGVPRAIGKLVAAVVWRTIELPVVGGTTESQNNMRVAETLPAWLPARRTIGGFYILRALSAGAVGSVFVATRVEDKGDLDAERFALKVPEYSANAARALSEAEFMTMFRDEARALIALPQHRNLARFVTFDAGCKPKPILVMELVEGTTLERLLEARGLTTVRALRVLDDVLRGLEAMHAVDVGHLDLKPSNVVMRRGEEAVLVDFGLAGRHIRPGCASGPYGAPEVWGALEGPGEHSPAKADVYALGCVAFEALTGRVLFDAETEMGQIATHVAHDGFPQPLRVLAQHRELTPLVELLFSALRRNPEDRPTAAMVRRELARIAPALGRASWPLGSR